MDFQLVVPSYNIFFNENAGKLSSVSGFGDITARVKYNIFGNDGDHALSVMPYLKLPTAQNNLGNKNFEGGIIFPAAFSLPYDFSLGAMVVWNYLRNDANSGYENTISSMVTVGHELVDNLSAYVELYSDKNLHNPTWIVTFDTGITYQVTPNIQLDWGMNIGVTPEADDFNPFMGLSVLF